LLFLAGSASAGPLPPYSLLLDKKSIQTIPIHTQIETLLIFPNEIEGIFGDGLTTGGKVAGSVLYAHDEENLKIIVLKHLDSESEILMTVMRNNEAFVFRLQPSESPASVVYLAKSEEEISKAIPVSEEEILLESRPVSEERKKEFIRLANESKLLRPRMPQEYEGYFEKAVMQPSTADGLKTTITKTAQFRTEDAFAFFGTIQNISSKTIHLGTYQGLLKIGDKRFFPPNILNTDKQRLRPNETATFEGLLIGDGNGQPLHIGLDNNFILHLSQIP